MPSKPEPHATDWQDAARFAEALGLLASGDLPSWSRGLDILLGLGQPAVAPLLARLADTTWTALHFAILEALGRLGAPEAAPAVAACLEHRDARRRLAAVRALRGMEPSTAPFLKVLGDMDWQVRQEAVFALGDTGAGGGRRLVPSLVRCLKDPHHRVRAAAANALGRVDGREAVAALRQALVDEQQWVASMAAWALGRLETERVPLQTPPAADHAHARVRQVRDLGRMVGDEGRTMACPLLVDLLEDSDAAVREEALEAVGRLGCVEAIPRLETLVRGGLPTMRRKAAWALAALGHPAQAALLRLLGHADEEVQQCAIFALGQLRVVSAAEGIFQALRAESEVVRTEARQSLERLKGKCAGAGRRK